MRLLKIGRDISCDIVLQSNKASALHAEMTLLDSGDILLEDKGSFNGTFVMGQPIKPGKPVKVKRGDKIVFADVELQWMQVPIPEDNSQYKAIWSVGSHFNNDIQLSGPTVSRYHATVKLGKNNKMYIFDHSKNGTTVDGQKIAPNTPCQIKKKSVIVCGGVPCNLSRLNWPADPWKRIVTIAASVVVLAGIGVGVWKAIDKPNPPATEEPIQAIAEKPSQFTDAELYSMYNNAIVLIVGVYHYELQFEGIGDLSSWITTQKMKDNEFPLASRYIFDDTTGECVPFYDESKGSIYTATGFFVSDDGKIVTNLHVAKPWLAEENKRQKLESELKLAFAQWATKNDVQTIIFDNVSTPYTALTSMIKLVGVRDVIALIPQGKYFSSENYVTCRVLSAGNNLDNDLALIQSEKAELPSKCRFINVTDSIDVNEQNLQVGKHIYTIGFPAGIGMQNDKSEKGLQVLAHGGNITQRDTEYGFVFDAASFNGASGSPIFDERGMLIGVLNKGFAGIMNAGIKAKYVKILIESPHKE